GFYKSIDLGEDSVMQLVALDGTLLARRSGDKPIASLDMSSSTLLTRAALANVGSFVSSGRLDGVVRYMSYRVLSDYGLVVSVGASQKHVLADSRERAFWYLLGSLAA